LQVEDDDGKSPLPSLKQGRIGIKKTDLWKEFAGCIRTAHKKKLSAVDLLKEKDIWEDCLGS
jgi:hypothetical protein